MLNSLSCSLNWQPDFTMSVHCSWNNYKTEFHPPDFTSLRILLVGFPIKSHTFKPDPWNSLLTNFVKSRFLLLKYDFYYIWESAYLIHPSCCSFRSHISQEQHFRVHFEFRRDERGMECLLHWWKSLLSVEMFHRIQNMNNVHQTIIP